MTLRRPAPVVAAVAFVVVVAAGVGVGACTDGTTPDCSGDAAASCGYSSSGGSSGGAVSDAGGGMDVGGDTTAHDGAPADAFASDATDAANPPGDAGGQ